MEGIRTNGAVSRLHNFRSIWLTAAELLPATGTLEPANRHASLPIGIWLKGERPAPSVTLLVELNKCWDQQLYTTMAGASVMLHRGSWRGALRLEAWAHPSLMSVSLGPESLYLDKRCVAEAEQPSNNHHRGLWVAGRPVNQHLNIPQNTLSGGGKKPLFKNLKNKLNVFFFFLFVESFAFTLKHLEFPWGSIKWPSV